MWTDQEPSWAGLVEEERAADGSVDFGPVVAAELPSGLGTVVDGVVVEAAAFGDGGAAEVVASAEGFGLIVFAEEFECEDAGAGAGGVGVAVAGVGETAFGGRGAAFDVGDALIGARRGRCAADVGGAPRRAMSCQPETEISEARGVSGIACQPPCSSGLCPGTFWAGEDECNGFGDGGGAHVPGVYRRACRRLRRA